MTGRYIRTLSIALGLFLLLAIWPERAAYAEMATIKQNTRVMERKGEKSRVLARVSSGKRVKVLAREGRWAKIRVDGKTGWVKTSSLSKPQRKTNRKSRFGRKGKNGTAPGDRVGADAVEGVDAPPDDGDESSDKQGSGAADDDDDDDDDGDGGSGEADDGASTSADGGEGVDDENPEVLRTAAKSALRRLDQAESQDNGDSRDSKQKNRDKSGDDDDDDDDVDAGDDDDDEASDLNLRMVVGADKVAMRREPRSRGKTLHTLYKGATLTVLKRSPDRKWYFIENSNGDQGWIRTSAVNAPGAAGYPQLMVRAGSRMGYSNLTQRFFSDGGPNYELAYYDLRSGAATARLGGDVFYHVTPMIVVGADLFYTNTYSTPGIEYQDANGNQTQTPFMMHELEAGGAVGVDFQDSRGILAYARAGYYYSRFGVSDYDDPTVNLARLPSEILNGMVVGGRIEVARLAGPLGLRVGGDVILPMVATRIQTFGLQDGRLVTAEGFWSGAQLTYPIASLNVEAGYRFAFAKTIWEGVSQRPTGALRNAFRKDYTHVISVGVGKAF